MDTGHRCRAVAADRGAGQGKNRVEADRPQIGALAGHVGAGDQQQTTAPD